MDTPEFIARYDPSSNKYLEMLRRGSFLLSREHLKDPNFDSTIVLVCHHTEEEGTYGLIVNRFSTMPLSEIFDGVASMDTRRKVFMGGPVRQEELQIVQVTDSPAAGAFRIAPRVFLGGEWPDLMDRLNDEDPAFMLFIGYSGWGKGQLGAEILAGAWEVYNADVEKVLTADPRSLVGPPERLRAFLRGV